MATILDTFFTRIGFDVDEAALKTAQSKIVGLGKSIMGLGIFSGLSVAGLYKLTTSTAESMGAVQELSERTGIAAESIAAMTKAGKDFNVTSEGMQESLQNVNRALGGIVTGTAPRMKLVFKALGLSATDAAGQQKDVIMFLGDVAEKIRGMSAGGQQQVLSRLGIDQNMVLMMRQGREEFMRLYGVAKRGIPWKAEDYERALKLDIALRKMKASISLIGQTIGVALMPVLQRFIDTFMRWWTAKGKPMLVEFRRGIEEWARYLGDLTDEVVKLTNGVDLLGIALSVAAMWAGVLASRKVAQWAVDGYKAVVAFARGITAAALAMQGGGDAAYWMARGMSAEAAAAKAAAVSTAAITGWVALIVVGIVALIAIIALAINDFKVWQRGGESLIGRFQAAFPKMFALVAVGFKRLRDAFVELGNALKQLWVVIGPVMFQVLKWLLIIVGVIIGGAIVAFVLLSYYAVLALTKILTWATRLQTFLLKLVPWQEIAAMWGFISDLIMATINDWIEIFVIAGEILQETWTDFIKFIQPALDEISKLWDAFTKNFTLGWQVCVDGLKAIWDAFFGDIQPALKAIESVFDKVKSAVHTGAQSTTIDTAPMGALTPSFAGVAGAYPPTSVTNANKTQQTNNHVDQRVVINVKTNDPKEAARLTAEAVAKQSPVVRQSQTGHR